MTGVHLVLFYDYVEDIVERRTPHREAHLARAREAVERGDLVLAGALGEPPHGAAFVFTVTIPTCRRPSPRRTRTSRPGW